MNNEAYFKDRVEDQIAWYDSKSQFNRRCFTWLKVMEMVCAATIPLLTGYIYLYQDTLTLAIGLLGVIVTLIAGLLELQKYQEKWLKYRTTCESLKKEKYLFQTKTSPYDCADEIRFKILVNRIEMHISVENTHWGQYISQLPKGDH